LSRKRRLRLECDDLLNADFVVVDDFERADDDDSRPLDDDDEDE
jgi:hypothetical protein